MPSTETGTAGPVNRPGPDPDAAVGGLAGRIAGIAPGWWVVLVTVAATTAFWARGVADLPDRAWLLPWMGPSLLISDWSIALMAVILVATCRSRMIEPLFGGLDRAVWLHRQLGPVAVGLVIAHVLMYIPPALEHGRSVGDLLVPFWSPTASTGTSLVLYALLIWTGLAYTRRFRYESWLSLHGMLGPIFLGTSAHALTTGPVIQAYEPLRFWMWLLVLAGGTAWAYRVLLYPWLAPRYRYRVEAVRPRSGDTVDLEMRPRTRRMIYEPGTFVFISRPGWGGPRPELHPFSISSSPAERTLRVSVRMVGDFTRDLPSLQPGDPVDVFGPFGGFTPHRYAHFRRLVCIGAGIGITPFLGMLRFETTDNDFRRIWVWYVVPDAERAPYHEEIRAAVPQADSWIDYALWPTAERGRLTAASVRDAVAPLDDFAVMLCGRPEFVDDMTRQFRALGLPRDRIIAEDFRFH